MSGPALVVKSGGGMTGQPAEGRGTHARRTLAGVRHLPRRRDRVAAPRRDHARGRRVHDPRSRQPERHLCQPQAHRGARRSRTTTRSRSAVPADLPRTMTTVTTRRGGRAAPSPGCAPSGRVRGASARSFRTFRSRRSATSRTRASSRRTALGGDTDCSRRRTSSA